MPLVRPFRTSFGVETDRDVILVRVRTPDGDGWGECVAMSEPAYSSEYVESALLVMRHHLAPRLLAAGDIVATDVARILDGVKGHRMAKCALEMAVLDAELRIEGVPYGDALGAEKASVECGVSVGIPNSLDELVEQVDGYLAEGYRRIKLKIEPGWDVKPVAAVRKTFGDNLLLQVDANTAYTRNDVVREAVAQAADIAELRASLPVGFDPADRASLDPVVDEALNALAAALSDPGTRAAVAEAVSKRLQRRQRSDTPPAPVRPLATVAAAEALDAATAVVARSGARPHVTVEVETVTVRSPSKNIALPIAARDAVARLLDGRPVTVGDLPLDERSAVDVARRLLREGVIVVAPPA